MDSNNEERKAVLVTDNVPPHIMEMKIWEIRVIVPIPNVTSLCQHMDQGATNSKEKISMSTSSTTEFMSESCEMLREFED
jgi:hypothetical protein